MKPSNTWRARARALWAAAKGDGCTSAPDFHADYTACCNQHDADYTAHATENGFKLTRAQADKRLLTCMRDKSRTLAGRWIVAPFYYAAVRAFARSHWKTSP